MNGGATCRGCGDVRPSTWTYLARRPCVRAINRRMSKISLAHTTGASANCNTGFLPAVTAATLVLDRFSYVRTTVRREGSEGPLCTYALPCRVRVLQRLVTPAATPRKPRPASAIDSRHPRLRGNAIPRAVRRGCSEGERCLLREFSFSFDVNAISQRDIGRC